MPPSLRDQFLLDPGVIFLNHGSFGATPRPVFDAYQFWQRELERQPVEFLGRRYHTLLAEARGALAAYLGAAADDLVFVPNATTGLNIVAHSLPLGPGDQVLSSDLEYGAADRMWRFLAAKQGFEYVNRPTKLPICSADEFAAAFFDGVTPSTRVIFLSHITSATAIVLPIRQICARARELGILTVIDGAHAPGQIPLDLGSLGADFYTGNCHKWLCAPKGSAFLFARPEVQPLIQPFIVSWGWQPEHPGPSPFLDLLEWTGTRDIAAYLSVPAAIRFQADHAWDAVRTACRAMAAETQRRLSDLFGYPPLHPPALEWLGQMGASQLPTNLPAETVQSQLYETYHIEIPVQSWNGRTLIRYSFQAYNRLEDIDLLVAALKEIFERD
jgi:isopenicillin-N epimerase